MANEPTWQGGAAVTQPPPLAAAGDSCGSCPECGGAAVQVVTPEDGGAISEPVMGRRGQVNTRKVRPATFYACNACEWCSEFRPAAWGPSCPK